MAIKAPVIFLKPDPTPAIAKKISVRGKHETKVSSLSQILITNTEFKGKDLNSLD